MGYTHHWYRPRQLVGRTFSNATKDIQKLYNAFAKAKAFESMDILPDYVEIRGGCEWFEFAKISEARALRPGPVFEFCKTDKLPYDLPVMCCLLVFKHYFKDDLKVSSDGDMKDWQPAIDLVTQELGWTSAWRFDEKEVDGVTDKSLIETVEVSKNA